MRFIVAETRGDRVPIHATKKPQQAGFAVLDSLYCYRTVFEIGSESRRTVPGKGWPRVVGIDRAREIAEAKASELNREYA